MSGVIIFNRSLSLSLIIRTIYLPQNIFPKTLLLRLLQQYEEWHHPAEKIFYIILKTLDQKKVRSISKQVCLFMHSYLDICVFFFNLIKISVQRKFMILYHQTFLVLELDGQPNLLFRKYRKNPRRVSQLLNIGTVIN